MARANFELIKEVIAAIAGCACRVRYDYDGERIWTHCDEHCPRVISGDWDHCNGC
jgi:hypothetical protein